MHANQSESSPPAARQKRGRAMLVGHALDSDGGHIRITFGDDFRLEGGSERTHRRMQECAVAVREELNRRGLAMQNITPEQFDEVVRVVQEVCDRV